MKMSWVLLLAGFILIAGMMGVWTVNAEQQDFEMNAYPTQIRSNPGREMVYVQDTSHYAVHYDERDAAPTNAVATLEDGSIAIFAGNPSTARITEPNQTLSSVYRLQPGGSLAVPTGLIFVRLTEGESIESYRNAIAAAGYEVVKHPPYAPHAAWVQSQSGNIADSLAGIAQLEAIPAVENVEPQMLMQAARR